MPHIWPDKRGVRGQGSGIKVGLPACRKTGAGDKPPRYYFGSCKNGFTLLEVLIATALLALLLTTLYGVFFTVLKAEDRVEGELGLYLDTRQTLDAISREIQSAFFNEKNTKTFFSGEGMDDFGRPTSSLSFTTFTYPVLQEGLPGSDLIAVTYKVEEGALLKEVWNPYLKSGEWRVESRDKETPAREGLQIPLVEGIEGFEVEFYNGKEWAKAWDAIVEKKLPLAVRITITLKEGAEKRGISAITIPRIF
ncbi:MAG: type II secretion system protein GspJ [Deltaproteobacteria bacterium]|nr:type II secretion system protein GspJ [Deltaproteobacteria bacterium]